MPGVIRLVAMSWALVLGQASVAGDLAAREEGPPPDGSSQTALSRPVRSGSPDRVARFGSGWTLRWHKRPHAIRKSECPNDPTDDETSDNPNDDDDAWDDLSADDDFSSPIVACLQETVPGLDAPERVPVTRVPLLSSPFLPLPRLRC
jgi:hypothetical protein